MGNPGNKLPGNKLAMVMRSDPGMSDCCSFYGFDGDEWLAFYGFGVDT